MKYILVLLLQGSSYAGSGNPPTVTAIEFYSPLACITAGKEIQKRNPKYVLSAICVSKGND